MSGLKALRNRIKSVKSTQKITKAMRMVSASKLHKAKEMEEHAAIFKDKLLSILAAVKEGADSSDFSDYEKSVLFPKDKYDNTLVIVFSSDRGLCGPFNSALYRKIRNETSLYQNPKFICVGKKIAELIKGKCDTIHQIDSQTPVEQIASKLKDMISSYSLANPNTKVVVYYTKFKNTLTQVPSSYNLIPVDTRSACKINNVEFEGENMASRIIDLYLGANLAASYYQSKASEEASRMTAMDNATRNAGEMIEKLTLKLNRSRQAHITKELIEVISGAEAV